MAIQLMSDQSLSFTVSGMTCAACSRNVERALRNLPDVLYASVNLASERAVVVSDKAVDFDRVKSAVEGAGYAASLAPPETSVHEKRYRRARRNLIGGLVITLPLTLLMILHMSGVHISGFHMIELLAGVIVIAGYGGDTLRGAWIALIHGHTNMDTLVSLGAITAVCTSLLAILGLDIRSFGALGSMLITLHMVGRYIESKLRDRAFRSVRSLIEMQSKEALLLENDKTISVPVEAISVDQRILVRSGDRIPLDGKVAGGDGYVDESMISGEPIPVRKLEGDPVTGGTSLTTGTLVVLVEKTGNDTYLSRMIQLVEEAQHTNIPIQALADRITNVFIPVIFGLALLSGLAWTLFYPSLQPFLIRLSSLIPWINADSGAITTALFAFISTLVIACPCAMGLATPMALARSVGLAAQRGLIIRDGEALHAARHLDILLLDKTGTLTAGKPQLVDTDLDRKTLSLAAGLEQHSSHPISHAIVQYARSNDISPAGGFSDTSEEAGKGIEGITGKTHIFIGKPLDNNRYRSMLSRAWTVVEVVVNGERAGYIAVSDPLKKDSADAVAQLKRMGIRPVMVTGDAEGNARAVSDAVNIEEFHAGMNPAAKAGLVRKFQSEGLSVGMIGDGINDAAAIKSADLGIAMGTGTDLAIQSGDIIIVSGELSLLSEAIRISRLTLQVIKQNLFWAFLYNIIAIPLAMSAVLHPLIAESAMTFSSITVILNSGRIRTSSGGMVTQKEPPVSTPLPG